LIEVTPKGIVTVVSLAQPWKALLPYDDSNDMIVKMMMNGDGSY